VSDDVILVLVSGGAVDISPVLKHFSHKIHSIIFAPYGGEYGGQAVGDVLFGAHNPSGRLTQTFYFEDDIVDQVSFEDMGMRPNVESGNLGRTYRFFTGSPLFPFGAGLSFTTFTYAWGDDDMVVSNKETIEFSDVSQDISLEVEVENSGKVVGSHSLLLFLIPPRSTSSSSSSSKHDQDEEEGYPLKSLRGVEKVMDLGSGESQLVKFKLNHEDFSLSNKQGINQIVGGLWQVRIGIHYAKEPMLETIIHVKG